MVVCRDCEGRIFRPEELAEHRRCDVLKHPTQKPMEVTRRLILSRATYGVGRVLIPFAGSGSECVAAQELGLEYVGIELNPEYVSFANQWLQSARDSRGPYLHDDVGDERLQRGRDSLQYRML